MAALVLPLETLLAQEDFRKHSKQQQRLSAISRYRNAIKLVGKEMGIQILNEMKACKCFSDFLLLCLACEITSEWWYELWQRPSKLLK